MERSKTEWKSLGFRLIPDAVPSGTKRGKYGQYHIYSETQVIPVSPARSLAAKKSAKIRADRLFDSIFEIEIVLPEMNIDELRNRAIDRYNAFHIDHDKHAEINDDLTFLNRICVNYLRHECTHYEAILENMKGKAGKEDAYDALRMLINHAIERDYPELFELNNSNC